MILSAHQPAYLPWLGYFDKILRSDAFIFLDSVQFEKNSFTNRNKIKTSNGPIWLTVPIKAKGHLNNTILDLEIEQSQNWEEKHLKSIYFNYCKAPFFKKNFPKLEKLYGNKFSKLADLCYYQLNFWLSELGVEKKIIRSSTLSIKSNNSKLILDLCESFGASQYISGIMGKDYLEEGPFEKANIKIEYQDYHHPIYPQIFGNFISSLSIVDFWMNSNNFKLITGREK